MISVKWIDHGREPQQRPDPAHPNGVDIDLGGHPQCTVDLPYPAKRCGVYTLKCDTCGKVAVVTTAGRPDDPRSIRMGCETGEWNH